MTKQSRAGVKPWLSDLERPTLGSPNYPAKGFKPWPWPCPSFGPRGRLTYIRSRPARRSPVNLPIEQHTNPVQGLRHLYSYDCKTSLRAWLTSAGPRPSTGKLDRATGTLLATRNDSTTMILSNTARRWLTALSRLKRPKSRAGAHPTRDDKAYAGLTAQWYIGQND